MKVEYQVVYPAVTRQYPNPSDPVKRINGVMVIQCDAWRTNTAMRKGMCDVLFAGFGNHPGNEADQSFAHKNGFEVVFDSGDQGINRAHGVWASARTRSMSIGDLVRLDPDGLNEWWVCDSCGWTLLTTEQAKSWIDYPREYGCDSFDLSNWMDMQLSA